jgi:methylenetetrahydrofolate dehydrogenase (NADP+)/methenyltetrahydrofolate cyclohydrolase
VDATAKIIDGKSFAERIRARISQQVAVLKVRHHFVPGLAVVLVGNDPASEIYVRSKGRATREAGMHSYEHRLPTRTSESELIALVRRLNEDGAVNGILVQLPLPPQISEAAVVASLDPEKDVDGFHVVNAGKLATGAEGLVPCTPLGCLMLLRDRIGELAGRRALVLGRSNIVGKPMAQLLLRENCTVTIAHSRTRDLPEEIRRAEILIVAVGKPAMVQGDWIRPGAVVIDVGVNRVAVDGDPGKTRLAGDVDFAAALPRVAAITPVPGGVGPMTIACLLANTVTAACRQRAVPVPAID